MSNPRMPRSNQATADSPPAATKRHREVIILGYNPETIPGGVTVVTRTLLRSLANARLLPIKHCYQPVRDARLYAASVVKFVKLLIQRRAGIITHLIVGSRGDRVRAIPILLLCGILRVPLCIQYHKNAEALTFSRGSLRDRLIDVFYRLCTLHVFLSKTLQGEFVSRIPELRTAVIQNALESDWLNIQSAPLKARDIDIVFFGRWNTEKGIEVLLRYLATTVPGSIRCEIFTDIVAETKVTNAVIKPWARQEEVRTALSRARLLVLPSYAEAYPTVILESLACGTPFVATDVGGIPDIAAQSEGGLVVKPGDAAALGQAIERLLRDPSEWKRRSQQGHEWVNRTCTIDQVRSLWESAYASIDN